MLYSEIKRETLSHIHRYTVAGKPVSASYNNQADYLNRIPVFINEALVNILTLVKREATVYPLTDGEEYGDCLRHELPDDFYTLRSGGVSRIRNGRFEPTNNYRLQGKKYILIPKGEDGEYTVEYYRYPNLLPLDAKDSFNLKEDIEVIQTATYYAAAQLALYDDEFLYASLYNDYESRLSRLSPGISTEARAVDDAYGFTAGWCE